MGMIPPPAPMPQQPGEPERPDPAPPWSPTPPQQSSGVPWWMLLAGAIAGGLLAW